MPPNNPASALAWRIRDIQHRHMLSIQSILERYGLHFGQPRILRTVYMMQGASQRDIAASLNVTAASLAMSVKRMCRSGLLEKKPDEGDLRITRIRLTEKGRRVYEESLREIIEADNAMLAGFSEQELAALTSYLDRIYANIDTEEGNLTDDHARNKKTEG